MADERINASKFSREPTLSKFGADLRWLLEKSGVDPEKVTVSIGVRGNDGQSKVIATLLREYNPTTMRRWDKYPNMLVIHGVPVWVQVTKEIA